MTDSVLAAVIATFGTIITGVLGYLAVVSTSTRKHAKAAQNQVQNSHQINLRDDLDEKFDGLASLVRALAADVGGIKEDIRIIHRDAGEDRRNLARETARIRELEQTAPRRRTNKKETPE